MHKIHYLKDYRPADFIIHSVHLYVDLHEEDTIVKTILKMQRSSTAHADSPLVLDGEELTLRHIMIDGQHVLADRYQIDDNSLTVFNVPDAFILETEVVIQPQKNTQLSGLYKSRSNFCTQCEAHGFRRITYYLDRPDVMSRFSTTITADQNLYPILLSNGNLIETKLLSNGRHWAHWEDPSLKPSYLFALVAGDFDLLADQFITQSGRQVSLHMYLEKGFKDQGDFALEALKHAMRWDEQIFGREYDLNIYMIVAVSDFNMGAMENKGLNIFNTKYILARPDTATDQDYVGIESVIGHEYFHNWSGNRVTCRDWFQITLKEGLTVLREQLFDADIISPAVARIDEVNALRNRQFLEDAGPNAHPVRPESYIEINNFYTATVYLKGAEVIRMVRTLLGPELFRKGMDLYFSRHDGQAVTTEDFIQAMADVSGRNFSQFFLWYQQSGTPRLDIKGDYQPEHHTFTLTVHQSIPPTPDQPHKKPLHLPLAVGLLDSSGKGLLPQLTNNNRKTGSTVILEVHDSQQVFTFTDLKQKPIPSLLRNFSAPVRVNYPYTLEELTLLTRCDTDVVARWEASQSLAVRVLLDLMKTGENDVTLALPSLWIQTIKELLLDNTGDVHLLTRLLTLPSEAYLAQQVEVIDIREIHRARMFAKHQLAILLVQYWLARYQNFLNSNQAYVYNPQVMGQRSLKNLCLNYLVASQEENYAKVALDQFRHSDNMTDVMGALWALNDYPGEARRQALAEFYDRWSNQPLVVNKWFLLQAASQLPDTLQTVQKLLNHPAFSLTNPNNVYNLIVTFSQNLIHFHAPDGSGYKFIADQVLAIDPQNPQVAARVLEPLTRWQRFAENNQRLMREQLERIKSSPKLSKDVYELVIKSLQPL